jgi:hypothetical protein
VISVARDKRHSAVGVKVTSLGPDLASPS